MKIIILIFTITTIVLGLLFVQHKLEVSRFNNCVSVLTAANQEIRSAVLSRAETLDTSLENIPQQELTEIIHHGHERYGETSETYVVDQNHILLVNSRFEGYLKKGDKLNHPSVAFALGGNSGHIEESDTYGIPMVSVYSSITYKDKTWAVITQIDGEEAVSSRFD